MLQCYDLVRLYYNALLNADYSLLFLDEFNETHMFHCIHCKEFWKNTDGSSNPGVTNYFMSLLLDC